jgi:nitrilase
MPTTAAAIQMCSSHIIDENLETAKRLITEAAEHDAKLIVLPEMFAFIGLHPNDKVAVKEQYGTGKIQDFLSAQARQHKVWIVGGTIPIAGNDDVRVRAACLVYNDRGEVAARYDKIHLFDVVLSDKESYMESEFIEPGNKIVVVDTPFGKLGLAVCFDVRFPELFRCMFERGAEIFILPSAFTVPTGLAHWEVLTRSRAIENFSYLIGSCQGGTHSGGRKTFGHSLMVAPWGNVCAKLDGTDTGVIYASIDLDKVYEARKAIPIARHQCISFDTSRIDD